jgi:mRNA deadenylase 3'-5' endonuclease subunit Ccr4
MRLATFNVLADAYTSYGDYSHATPELMQPGARLEYLSHQINHLGVDVIGLQEADRSLVEVFEDDKDWQSFWTPKGRNKPDGCPS